MFKLLGLFFLGLGFLGVFLPLLPTTPFILLSAACFARSSKKWYEWLLNHKVFGSIIRDWEENRCIPYKYKIFAISMILIFGGTSTLFALPKGTSQLLGLAIMIIGVVYVFNIKACDSFRNINKEP